MIKRISLALTIAALVVGCSSGVKLDEVPIEDKTASTLSGGADAGGNTGNAAQGNGGGAGGDLTHHAGGTTGPAAQGSGGVAGVDLTQPARDPAGPVGIARIVYFDYDSYVIKPEFQTLIEAHSRFIKTDTKRKLMLEGHTDERGGREYNLSLGQKRAEAVRRALGLPGVPDSQMEAVSFGKEKL